MKIAINFSSMPLFLEPECPYSPGTSQEGYTLNTEYESNLFNP
jgi:hypothetical protein